MSLVQAADPADDGSAGRALRLSDLDRDFLRTVPGPEQPLAERVAIATRHQLAPGTWMPESLVVPGRQPPHAIVIQEGVIVRDVFLGGRASSHLFGPGELLRPWHETDTTLTAVSRWTCGADGAVIAVLGQRFVAAARRWPGISTVVQERLAEQLDTAILRTAIVSLPRAEQRILALLWHLADRWGTVTEPGVIVRLQLTHELIGRIVGARRPTVTLALQVLAEEGLLTRTDADHWCLAHGSHRHVDPRGDSMASVGG